jgi:chromosome partitioning protein
MIITLSQKKGGSGKSTLAVSLAVAILQKGFSVGLLDTDDQRSAHKWYGRRCKRSGGVADIECNFAQGDIKDVIKGMSARNQILIIDTAGFHSHELRLSLVFADMAITPFRPKPYDLEVAAEQMQIIEEIRVANPDLLAMAVINSAPTNANDSRADNAAEYLTEKKYHVFKQRIYNREAYGDAVQSGLGVTEHTDSLAKHEMEKLIQEVLSVKK